MGVRLERGPLACPFGMARRVRQWAAQASWNVWAWGTRVRKALLYIHAEHLAALAYDLAQDPEWENNEDAVIYGPGAVLRALPWGLTISKETMDDDREYWRAAFPHFGRESFRAYGDTQLEAILDLAEMAPGMIYYYRQNKRNPLRPGFTVRWQVGWHLRALVFPYWRLMR